MRQSHAEVLFRLEVLPHDEERVLERMEDLRRDRQAVPVAADGQPPHSGALLAQPSLSLGDVPPSLPNVRYPIHHESGFQRCQLNNSAAGRGCMSGDVCQRGADALEAAPDVDLHSRSKAIPIFQVEGTCRRSSRGTVALCWQAVLVSPQPGNDDQSQKARTTPESEKDL
jgi:hypothetical protein